MKKIMWFDTETTGLDAVKNDIIQIAGFIEIEGEVVETFDIYSKPISFANINERALEVNGRTIEELKSFPPASKAAENIITVLQNYFDGEGFAIGGHNISYDKKMLIGMFTKLNLLDTLDQFLSGEEICTLTIAKDFFGYKLKNHKLGTVADYYGIKFEAHEALNDITATRDIYYRMQANKEGVEVVEVDFFPGTEPEEKKPEPVEEVPVSVVETNSPEPEHKKEHLFTKALTEVKQLGIADSKVSQLRKITEPMYGMLEQFEASYDLVASAKEVTPEIEVMASTLRKKILKIRTGADKARKAEKKESQLYGKAVDGIFNQLIYVVSEKEDKLKEIENTSKRLIEEKQDQLRIERKTELEKYEYQETEGLDLGIISEEMYQNLLAGTKAVYEKKIEADKKAAEEAAEKARKENLHNVRFNRIAPISSYISALPSDLSDITDDEFTALVSEAETKKAEAEAEQKRIQEENERLKKEAEEKERKEREQQAERNRIENEKRAAEEAKKRAEQEAEAAKKAKQEAEEKARIAQEEAERKEKEELEHKADEAVAKKEREKREAQELEKYVSSLLPIPELLERAKSENKRVIVKVVTVHDNVSPEEAGIFLDNNKE